MNTVQTFKTLFRPHVKSLETPRLSIRIDTEEAYVAKFRSASDSELMQYFGIQTDEDLEVQKVKVHGGLSTYRSSVVFFHLIDRSMNKVIGSFAFHNWYAMHRRSEVGYAMSADEYKNKGYMSEAMAPIIEFGFGAMDLNRMEAFIHPENMPSRKLVERFGFRKEGQLAEHFCNKGDIGDSMVYGLLAKDYADGISI